MLFFKQFLTIHFHAEDDTFAKVVLLTSEDKNKDDEDVEFYVLVESKTSFADLEVRPLALILNAWLLSFLSIYGCTVT